LFFEKKERSNPAKTRREKGPTGRKFGRGILRGTPQKNHDCHAPLFVSAQTTEPQTTSQQEKKREGGKKKNPYRRQRKSAVGKGKNQGEVG